MWRRKKIIIIGLLVIVLLVGSISGVALAQTGSGSDTQSKTLLARVAEILGIDQQRVEDAFTQARSEMRNEALDNYLNNLVTEGKITQEQSDQYKTWQQARPGVPLPGPFGRFGDEGGMMRGGGRYFCR